MRIALVDDDVKFLAQTARLLEIMLEHRGMRAEIMQFASVEKLLARLSVGEPFDMYLLDVVMPGIDGIGLGRRIRRNQPDVPIIFLTTSKDFALESYSVHAVDYIVKPFGHEAFARAIEFALKNLATVRPVLLGLRVQEGIVNIRVQNIVYAEADGHNKVVHVTGERPLTTRLTLQELWEKLGEDERFVQIGRQLIVNLAHVRKYANGTLVLSDGKRLSVPRRLISQVKESFSKFYGA